MHKIMDLSIGKLQAKRTAMNPNKECYRDVLAGISLTFQEHNTRSDQTVHVLKDLGIQHGDRVAVFMMNCAEYMETFYACAKIGAICVPINWRLALEEVIFILKDSGAKIVVYSPEFSELIGAIHARGSDATNLENYLCNASPQNCDDWATSFSDLRDQASKECPGFEGTNMDQLLIMYTSGTTGHPKGVIHSHYSIMWAIITMSGTMHTSSEDRFITPMPMFHVAALLPILQGMYEGFTMLVVNQFDPSKIWKQIESEKATCTLLVPAMLNFMLHVPEKDTCDYSSMKWIMAGAAPVPTSLIQAYAALGLDIHQVYGLTESAGPACVIVGEDALQRIGSAGKGFLHTEVRVVNDKGEDTEPGEIGEVIVAGGNVMHGYWNQPEATENAIRDGWLYTGDAATIDDDGFIYIVDRIKDMIISGGENIYPAEVEGVLAALPGIREVAVVGREDEKWGEVPVAFIVKADEDLTEETIYKHLQDKLASFKRPKDYYYLDALPRNPSGKVLKTDLRKQL